jgi:predicted PurR-regulated permease PerM
MTQQNSSEQKERQITAFEIVWRSPWVRAVTYIILGLFILWVLWSSRGGYAFALQVGIIGFVIAYVLNPLVNVMKRIKIRRALAVVIVYIALLSLLVFGSVLITQVVTELGKIIALIPDALSNIGTLTNTISQWFTKQLQSLPSVLSDRFGVQTSSDELTTQVQTQLQGFLTNALESPPDRCHKRPFNDSTNFSYFADECLFSL